MVLCCLCILITCCSNRMPSLKMSTQSKRAQRKRMQKSIHNCKRLDVQPLSEAITITKSYSQRKGSQSKQRCPSQAKEMTTKTCSPHFEKEHHNNLSLRIKKNTVKKQLHNNSSDENKCGDEPKYFAARKFASNAINELSITTKCLKRKCKKVEKEVSKPVFKKVNKKILKGKTAIYNTMPDTADFVTSLCFHGTELECNFYY